jgi:hypothetical protein
MHFTGGTFTLAVLAACLTLVRPSRAGAQTTARSSVIIPLKKEKAAPQKVVTVHDTITMVRVDTVRIVQTLIHTDTVFRVDTLRDSCSRAAFPFPIPVPRPIDHGHNQPPTVDPAPIETSVTPEPETFMLVGTGLAATVAYSRYKRRK